MIFQARRARPVERDTHGRVVYGPKILCGFGQASMNNYCDAVIAWVAEQHPGKIIIPNGLTDADTPGVYRMGAYAAARKAEGRKVMRRRRNDPDLEGHGGYPQPLRMVEPPVVIPCEKGHQSRVDDSVFSRRQA